MSGHSFLTDLRVALQFSNNNEDNIIIFSPTNRGLCQQFPLSRSGMTVLTANGCLHRNFYVITVLPVHRISDTNDSNMIPSL